MCLHTVWTKEKQEKWMEKKPDPVIAYKMVQKGRVSKGIHPLMFKTNQAFKKTNKLLKSSILTVNVGEGEEYKAGYHLCLTKTGADRWAGIRLKCEIPKKAILAIGIQGKCIAIVTEEFTFVEGDEYFKEEK